MAWYLTNAQATRFGGIRFLLDQSDSTGYADTSTGWSSTTTVKLYTCDSSGTLTQVGNAPSVNTAGWNADDAGHDETFTVTLASDAVIPNGGGVVVEFNHSSQIRQFFSPAQTGKKVAAGSYGIVLRMTSDTSDVDWVTYGGGFAYAPDNLISSNGQPLIDKLSASDAGFVDVSNGGDTTPFASGDQISYTVQGANALSPGTYYWRVRGKDPSGTNTFGAWSGTRSFTVSATHRNCSVMFGGGI